MSYILDALRRAEAERERGAVPSLQSQQHTIVEDDAAGPARSHALLWAGAGVAVALVAVLAWSLSGGSAPPARPVVEGSAVPAAPSPAPILLPTTPAAAPMQSAAPAVQPVAEPPPAPTAASKSTVRPPADAKRTADAQRPARRGAEAGKATTGEPETARAAGEPRIYKQIELPEEIRRELPKLTVGGASYSGDAASRMVMINGQIFHEGAQLGQGLVLERIKLKSAVLSYKGYRYEVTF